LSSSRSSRDSVEHLESAVNRIIRICREQEAAAAAAGDYDVVFVFAALRRGMTDAASGRAVLSDAERAALTRFRDERRQP